jgi:hypothetical protein
VKYALLIGVAAAVVATAVSAVVFAVDSQTSEAPGDLSEELETPTPLDVDALPDCPPELASPGVPCKDARGLGEPLPIQKQPPPLGSPETGAQ